MIRTFAYDLLNDEHWIKFRSELPKYDLIFTDPPWGDGTLKMFRSTVNRMGVEGKWSVLMERLAVLAKAAQLGTFVMMGQRFTPEMVEIFETNGQVLHRTWEGVYSSKKIPFDLIYFGKFHNVLPDLTGVNGRHESPLKAMEPFLWWNKKLQVVLDPFVGLGDTFYATKKLGLDAIGNEINPDRLARAVSLCERTKK